MAMTGLTTGSTFTAALARAAVALAGCVALLAPLDAAAQSAAGTRRIGFINIGPAALNTENVAAFRAGLAELGHVEGRNLVIDFRWADNKAEQLPALAAELLALKPDVILSTGGPVVARAVKAATTTVPVVFITNDPVFEKLVTSMAKPGGNLTGVGSLANSLDAKRLELLQQLVPRARRVAVIWNPNHAYGEALLADIEAAGKRLGLTLLPWRVSHRAQLEAAFAEIAAAKPDALFVVADAVLGFERVRIVELAHSARLPAMYFWREFAKLGGMASFGTNLPAAYHRTASYVDRIFKGAKPGDLPVEQPTTFEFVINLKAAKAIGVDIPQTMRQRADEVIE